MMEFSLFLYGIFGCSLNESQAFSYLIIIIIGFIYFVFVIKRITVGYSASKIDKKTRKYNYENKWFVTRLTSRAIEKILNRLLGGRISFYTVFSRQQIGGKVDSFGRNIPPIEDYGCIDTIVRYLIRKRNHKFGYEIRFKKKHKVIKVRRAKTNDDAFGKFHEIRFSLRRHFWLFLLMPFRLSKWYLFDTLNWPFRLILLALIAILFLIIRYGV